MSFLKCLRVRGRLAGSGKDRPASAAWGWRTAVLSILIISLAVVLRAQDSSQIGVSPGSQVQSNQDCSDPLLASTPECSGQTQLGLNPNSGQSLPSLGAGALGNQPQNTGSNYSTEVGQYSRQNTRRDQQVVLPPEPLTELQKFIASTTSQILPIYGADLFRRVPSTFAPLDMTPVPADYVVGPNDELRIHVWGQVNFQSVVRVDRSGEVFLPQVGPVHVAGLPFSAVDAHLRAAVGRIFHNFDLTVDVGQIRAIQIYVSGQARRPGVYTVSSLSSLVDALFLSGGPSVQGSMRHIQLRRDGKVVTDFDLYDLLIEGDKSKDVKLQAEDVIYIPPVGAQAAITGSVRNPAIYELRENETLAALLAEAGGVTSVASEARISIERIEDHRDRQAMEIAYDESGLATTLTDGDLVRVFSIVPKYQKTVILRGNIANPGRFAWRPGMHVSDLIPDKESLITRNYWWKRTQLGLPAPEFEPIQGLDNLRQPTDNTAVSVERARQESRTAATQQGVGGTPPAQPASTPGQTGTQPGQSANEQDMSGTPTDQTGSNQNSNQVPDQRTGNSSIAATQASQTGLVSVPGQRTEVGALAPEIDWDYAVIERINPENLKTVLIPFDLGKLVLEHDRSQDLELDAGDVVSVFSGADIRLPIAHQTKFVRLDGEIAHAGVYTVQPGETLRDLVERAGGVTPNAYLFGSQFTRESARAIQQARIDEYVQTLGMQIQRRNLAASASPASGEPDLLGSLRRIRATGRVVLQFTPNSSGTNSVPPIPLEDGDRFVIPPVPATVNVVGAVYDQTSFLYSRERKTGSYLQLAGGANRDADKGHEFIIRADGEVVSRARSKSLWSGNEFNNLGIYPGDTIVVPDKTFRPSVWTGVLNSAQTLASFALDAAVLTSIQ
jgi:protein involved in polysaccharide export with SLBB domain